MQYLNKPSCLLYNYANQSRSLILDGLGMAYIPLTFPADGGGNSPESRRQMFQWELKVADKPTGNLFPHSSLLCPDEQYQSLFLLCWNLPRADWQEKLLQFSPKLESARSTIVQICPRVLAADYFSGEAQLEECRHQLFALRDYY